MKMLRLNELTWDNRSLWPQAYRYLVCALPGFCIFFLVFYFFIYPMLGRYDVFMVEQAKLLKQLQQSHREVMSIHDFDVQIQQMKNKFSSLLKQLPTKNEMPSLLESISNTGIALGLTFQLFAPQPEIKHAFYVEIPVNITMVGTYEQMIRFFIKLSNLSQLITVHDFTVTSATDMNEALAEATSPAQEKLIMTVTVKIYQYVNVSLLGVP
jgi:type IV pilus assembly protein PilO